MLIVIGVIVKGMAIPISAWAEPGYEKPPIVYGFIEGYTTSNLLCGLVFGVIILNSLKEKGVTENRLNAMILKVGIIGSVMLF